MKCEDLDLIEILLYIELLCLFSQLQYLEQNREVLFAPIDNKLETNLELFPFLHLRCRIFHKSFRILDFCVHNDGDRETQHKGRTVCERMCVFIQCFVL